MDFKVHNGKGVLMQIGHVLLMIEDQPLSTSHLNEVVLSHGKQEA